jgi:hypothetical protein
MDVTPNVLSGTALYIQYREAQQAADAMADKLGAITRHMSEREHQAYVHITGMYDIAHGAGMQPIPPLVHADSVPMPALTPEALEAYEQTRVQ